MTRMMELTPKIRSAVRRAVNNTATGVRTDLSRAIMQDFYIKAADIKAAIKIDPATNDRIVAYLHGSNKPGIKLFDFRHTPTRVPSTIRTKGGGYAPELGISVAVTVAAGMKGILGAFTARMPSGHEGIWIRTGVKTAHGRAKIRELFGPSVEKLLAGRRYKDVQKRSVDARIEKNLAHEMHYALEVQA